MDILSQIQLLAQSSSVEADWVRELVGNFILGGMLLAGLKWMVKDRTRAMEETKEERHERNMLVAAQLDECKQDRLRLHADNERLHQEVAEIRTAQIAQNNRLVEMATAIAANVNTTACGAECLKRLKEAGAPTPS